MPKVPPEFLAGTGETRIREELIHLLENMTDGFLALDSEWRITYINAEGERLNGMRREEIVGQNHWELFPASVGTVMHTEFLRAAEERVPVEFENYYAPWQRWLHVKAYPAANGGLSVFYEDITPRKALEEERAALFAKAEQEVARRKEVEEELREREKRFREMIDVLPAAIYTTDAEGRLTYFNPAAVKLSGRTPELGTDQWCVTWKLFHPDGTPMPHDACPMAMTLKEGRSITGAECIAERPDGSRFWFAAFPTCLRDDEGRVAGGINMLLDISDRKEAERASLRLSAIVDSSDDAIISKDLNGIIQSWNKSAERLFGYTADEVIGKSITIIIPPDRLSEEPEILRRLQRGERVDHFETIRRRKDGSLLNISLTISPVKDKYGNVIGASKIARDITERRNAQEAIQALNAQLTAELVAMTRMQQLSTRFLQADEFGILLDEIIDAGMEITRAGMGSIQLLEGGVLKLVSHRGFEAPFINYFECVEHGVGAGGAALATAERVIIEEVEKSPIFAGSPELEVMLAAGVRAMQSTPLISRSGQMLGIFSTHYRTPQRPDARALRMLDVLARQAADLIERKRAEAELLASEGRFRQLADSMPQIVWTARADGYFDYFNNRWYEFTGFSRDLFGDASWQSLLHPEDLRRSYESWYSSVRSGEPYQIEYRFWDRQEKRWRWFIGRALPARDQSGRIVKWFGTCTDIDDQKRVEDDLRHANEDLEQFAYSASHDLQEPLRGIKIYSELLSRRYADALEGQALEFLNYLRGNASRMEMLVRDLLAYTQITKQGELDENTDASEALAEALANLGGAIVKSGARISSDPLPSVPVHSAHLKQLFQNLVGNAIKYRSPERVPTVHVSAERQDEFWLFSVADNGIGIEPEYKERIFGLFKRLHSGDEYSGTGIGLAICQRIVDRYRGRIWVESTPEKGSTFKFTLPC